MMPDCPILQFGTSRFLQAHVDLFVAEAKAGPIAVVQTTNSPESIARIAGFRALRPYPVHLRGLRGGTPVDRTVAVDSVAVALHADRDWAAVRRRFIAAQWIVSNTGDRGYEAHAGDGPDTQVPRGFPAKLTMLLHERWRAGAPGPTLMPCELISGNGDVLRALVAGLAEAWGLPQAFRAWLRQECRWINALVDRIVPTSLDPVGAIAEPYALWAIEDQPGFVPPCTHSDIKVVADLAPYERLKLYILNLGHTVLAERWRATGREGDETVLAAMGDPGMTEPLEEIYDAEVLPVFAALGLGPEAVAYRASVRDRFGNPTLRHRLADIFVNHAAKKQRRIGAFITLGEAALPSHAMPRLRRLLASEVS